ncbi:MAG: hypothetical protein ACRCUS_06320 [Anaerovoracaceae bacterium]
MALIKCKECGKEISEQALACPSCGCPNLAEEKEKRELNTEANQSVVSDIAEKDQQKEKLENEIVVDEEVVQQIDETYIQNQNNGNIVKDVPGAVAAKKPIGWAVLSFLLPIVGLILFLKWRKNESKKAKWVGVSAIIGIASFFAIIGLALNQTTANQPWKTISVEDVDFQIASNWEVKKGDETDYYYLQGNNFFMVSKPTKDGEGKDFDFESYMEGVKEGFDDEMYKDSEVISSEPFSNINGVKGHSYKVRATMSDSGEVYIFNAVVVSDDTLLYSFAFVIKEELERTYEGDMIYVFESLEFNDGREIAETELEPDVEESRDRILDIADVGYGWFLPYKIKGDGDKVIQKLMDASTYMMAVKHSGGSNFAIKGLDSDGDLVDIYVNEIGNYKGTVAVGFPNDAPTKLQITADGNWSIEFKPISEASKLEYGKRYKGSKILYFDGYENFDAKIEHLGKSNFAIWLAGLDEKDLLVNEVGKYKGVVPINDISGFFIVEADGKWSITKE